MRKEGKGEEKGLDVLMLALNAVLFLIGGAVKPFSPLSSTKPLILPSQAHFAHTTKTSA